MPEKTKVGGIGMQTECDCYNVKLLECVKCATPATYTDSARRDRIVTFLQNYSKDGRRGSYYFPALKAAFLQEKKYEFYVDDLRHIEHVLEGLSKEDSLKIIHESVIQFIGWYDGWHFAQGLDNEGHVRWTIC